MGTRPSAPRRHPPLFPEMSCCLTTSRSNSPACFYCVEPRHGSGHGLYISSSEGRCPQAHAPPTHYPRRIYKAFLYPSLPSSFSALPRLNPSHRINFGLESLCGNMSDPKPCQHRQTSSPFSSSENYVDATSTLSNSFPAHPDSPLSCSDSPARKPPIYPTLLSHTSTLWELKEGNFTALDFLGHLTLLRPGIRLPIK